MPSPLNTTRPGPVLRSLRPGALLLSLLLSLQTAACARNAGATVSRELFVQTYVELRRAAQEFPGELIDLETRDRILAERGVTAEQLTDFVEVHGRDPLFMGAVWEEIDRAFSGGTEAAPGLEGGIS